MCLKVNEELSFSLLAECLQLEAVLGAALAAVTNCGNTPSDTRKRILS